MIDSKLTELLERAGDQTDVGPPPIDAMYARVARVRRRRTVALSIAASVAVVAAAGGTALLVRPGTGSEDTPPPVASTSPGVVPADVRLVGVGHAAIAVPKEWATNKEHCGTPQADTVIYDLGARLLCLMPRPSGVESVELASGKPAIFDFRADETFEIDGVPAERQRTSCTTGPLDQVEVCSGTVFIPSLDASFRAQSSTSADEVDRLLEQITIVSDRVGVPAFRTIGEDGRAPTSAKYIAALRKLGLTPKVQTIKSPGYDPDYIMAVSPVPGTMLPVGATVTLTVVAP